MHAELVLSRCGRTGLGKSRCLGKGSVALVGASGNLPGDLVDSLCTLSKVLAHTNSMNGLAWLVAVLGVDNSSQLPGLGGDHTDARLDKPTAGIRVFASSIHGLLGQVKTISLDTKSVALLCDAPNYLGRCHCDSISLRSKASIVSTISAHKNQHS